MSRKKFQLFVNGLSGLSAKNMQANLLLSTVFLAYKNFYMHMREY